MYWWGLAGNKDGLMLQQETGCTEIMLQLLHEAAGEAITAQAAADEQKARAHGSKAAMDVDQQQHQSGCASPSEVKQDIGSPMDQSPKAEVLIWPIDHKGLLLPAGTEAWALIEDAELLETLANNLEQRGVREKDLKQTLDKVCVVCVGGSGEVAVKERHIEASCHVVSGSLISVWSVTHLIVLYPAKRTLEPKGLVCMCPTRRASPFADLLQSVVAQQPGAFAASYWLQRCLLSAHFGG